MTLGDMTEEAIRALKPGHEFDQLVARDVMGWESNEFGVYWQSGPVAVASTDLFRPSTDMASAWIVLQRCRLAKPDDFVFNLKYEGDGFELLMQFGTEYSRDSKCICVIGSAGTGEARAISCAALLAAREGLLKEPE